MFTAETQVRVRYAETDQMGYVYYGNYATYYEVGRVETMRQIGISYKTLEKEGIMMPVVDCQSKYIRPARYDDLLTIKISIPEMPQVKIRFNYELYNEAETLIHKGHTVLYFVDMETNKPCRIPEHFHDLLAPYFDA